MTVIEHEPGTPLPDTGTNWERVHAMTDEEVLQAALSDPDAQPIPSGSDEELEAIGLYRVVNLFVMRKRLELTQEEFAARYKIPVGTLRDWEQKRKYPDATARAYLKVIEANPELVAKALNPQAA